MPFWIAVAALALLTAWWTARPFLRRGTLEMEAGDSTISIYRDQLDEVARDRAAGLINAAESEAARREIERRALTAARNLDQGFLVGHRSVAAGGTLVALFLLAGIGTYAILGNPGVPDQPLAQRRAEMLASQSAAGDVNASIQLLIDSTEEDPADFASWWLLAKSYAAIGDNAAAADAYRQAATLSGDDPAVLSAYGEAMTLANRNKVPTAARVIFEQVLRTQPDARARYYLALAKAQAQDFEAAIADWAALARESDPQAPWMPLVRRDIANMARFLEVDVTEYLPDATPAEIASASGTRQVAASENRVIELERAVETDPNDYKAWLELASEQAGLGNANEALAALETGRQHFRAAPFLLQMFDQRARALGLDMLDGPELSGPTSEDIAAASDLTQAETDDMIDGMVAGLAAKLEENPDNLDGWIMLVRSYSNLGQVDKASDAYRTALSHFAGNDPALAALRKNADPLVRGN